MNVLDHDHRRRGHFVVAVRGAQHVVRLPASVDLVPGELAAGNPGDVKQWPQRPRGEQWVAGRPQERGPMDLARRRTPAQAPSCRFPPHHAGEPSGPGESFSSPRPDIRPAPRAARRAEQSRRISCPAPSAPSQFSCEAGYSTNRNGNQPTAACSGQVTPPRKGGLHHASRQAGPHIGLAA